MGGITVVCCKCRWMQACSNSHSRSSFEVNAWIIQNGKQIDRVLDKAKRRPPPIYTSASFHAKWSCSKQDFAVFKMDLNSRLRSLLSKRFTSMIAQKGICNPRIKDLGSFFLTWDCPGHPSSNIQWVQGWACRSLDGDVWGQFPLLL